MNSTFKIRYYYTFFTQHKVNTYKSTGKAIYNSLYTHKHTSLPGEYNNHTEIVDDEIQIKAIIKYGMKMSERN
jgi:hypothetical protein